MAKALMPVWYVGYFILGLTQLFATVAGLAVAFDIHGLWAGVIALIVAWMPLVGAIAGVYGAAEGWGWSIWAALALFFGPYLILVGIVLVEAAMDSLFRRSS